MYFSFKRKRIFLMGEIIFWTIIRTAIVIPLVWISSRWFDYSLWWSLSLLVIYGVILHPAIIYYQLFKEKNQEIIEFTLCSSCKHFDDTAVLCLKHDEHPTRTYLPCDGIDWELKNKIFKENTESE